MKELWMAGVLGLGFVLRLALIFQPVEMMLSQTLPDDAFYYLVIARNAASGLGVTFDGAQATNGFHPLWAVVLMPVFRLIEDGQAALRVALGLGALLDTGAAAVFAVTAERMLKKSGIFVAAIYLFNPRLVMESVNGLETSVGMLCLAITLWSSLAVYERGRWHDWARMGVAAALAFLARTDLAIIIVVVVSGIAIQRLRGPVNFRQRAISLVGRLGVAAAAGLVVVSPWLLWNLARFGTLVQSSAVATPFLAHYRISQGGDAWGELMWPVINYSLRNFFIYPGVSWIILAVGLMVLIYLNSGAKCGVGFTSTALSTGDRLNRRRWLSLSKPGRRLFRTGNNLGSRDGAGFHDGVIFKRSQGSLDDIKAAYLLWAPLAGATVLILVHTLVRWYPRGWYFAPLAGVLALASGVVLARIWPILRTGMRLGLILMIVVIVTGQILKTSGETTYPGQVAALASAQWLKRQSTADSVAGAFNAGILAYFSERQVVNLDGVVDWEAIRARDEHGIIAYLIKRDGEYLIDQRAYIWDSFGPFLGPEAQRLEAVESFGEDDTSTNRSTIYRVRDD